MNQDPGGKSNTLPFALPVARPARGGGDARSSGPISAEMLDIVKQEPDMNISKTVLMSRKIDSGRYRVNAYRVARRLREFENRLLSGQDRGCDRAQDNGGRNLSSNGRSSTSSTSHDGGSN